eukprot:2225357-Lingulodinium_polyedra.AAC.1
MPGGSNTDRCVRKPEVVWRSNTTTGPRHSHLYIVSTIAGHEHLVSIAGFEVIVWKRSWGRRARVL